MEQIKDLIEVLSKTPELALWGLGMYFLFILFKLASWIVAAKMLIQLFINRYFNHQESRLELQKEELAFQAETFKEGPALEILEYFENKHIGKSQKMKLIKVLDAMRSKSPGGLRTYIHDSDFDEALEAIEKAKK